jgi:hypothetical protein
VASNGFNKRENVAHWAEPIRRSISMSSSGQSP